MKGGIAEFCGRYPPSAHPELWEGVPPSTHPELRGGVTPSHSSGCAEGYPPSAHPELGVTPRSGGCSDGGVGLKSGGYRSMNDPLFRDAFRKEASNERCMVLFREGVLECAGRSWGGGGAQQGRGSLECWPVFSVWEASGAVGRRRCNLPSSGGCEDAEEHPGREGRPPRTRSCGEERTSGVWCCFAKKQTSVVWCCFARAYWRVVGRFAEGRKLLCTTVRELCAV